MNIYLKLTHENWKMLCDFELKAELNFTNFETFNMILLVK